MWGERGALKLNEIGRKVPFSSNLENDTKYNHRTRSICQKKNTKHVNFIKSSQFLVTRSHIRLVIFFMSHFVHSSHSIVRTSYVYWHWYYSKSNDVDKQPMFLLVFIQCMEIIQYSVILRWNSVYPQSTSHFIKLLLPSFHFRCLCTTNHTYSTSIHHFPHLY